MAESKIKGFGDRLRSAREQAGRDIQSLADVTRVQGRYIQALESEDWSVVPKGVIGRGFVRVIARELGAPPAEFLQLYQAARGDADSEPDRSLPETDWKVDLGGGRRGKPVLIAAAVLVVAVFAIWLWANRSSGRKDVVEAPSQAPAVVTEAPTPAVALKEPSAPVPSASTSVVPASPAPVAPVPQQASLPAPTVPAPDGLRLELEAREKVWVRVSEDGGPGQEKLLKAGERVGFRAKSGFQVKLGNAGAVTLYWNGEALKSAGRSSRVVSLSLPEDLASLKP